MVDKQYVSLYTDNISKNIKEPMEIHTLLESVIERKNHYQGRMAENMVNIIYFTKRKAELEKERDLLDVDTEERAAKNVEVMQAQKAIDSGNDNVEADKMLMKSFDDVIRDMKKK